MAGGLFALSDFATKLILGRGYQRQLYKHQIAQHQMAIDNAQRGIQEFEQQKTYNRAILGQSFAARGLSNSTIASQGTGNFDATAARREAAMNQNLTFQQQGMSLLKTYHKYQQRMLIYNGIRAAAETVVSAYSGMSGGGFGSTGSEADPESNADPAGETQATNTDPSMSETQAGQGGWFSDTGGGGSSDYGNTYGDTASYGGGGSDYGGGSPD